MRESFLRRRVRLITIPEEPKHICTKDYSDQCDPIQPWSLLKLGALRYLTSIYLPIISEQVRQRNFRAVYYIDLFSGCAVNRIEGRSAKFYGSPLIPCQVQKEKNKRFTKMFLNDIDSEKAFALRQCLSNFTNIDDSLNFSVTNIDANECIKEIKSEMLPNSHSLIFVDPNYMAFSWKSMESILKMRADIFFLYPTANVQRTLGKEEVDAQTRDFFKDYEKANAIWQDVINPSRKPSAILDMYLEDVIAVRGLENTRIETIRINGGSYYYDMLFISRRTAEDNPWWDGVTDLKNGLRHADGNAVNRILSTTQSSLEVW